MNKPSFTVIIPIYNSEKYINRAIESVLSQTYDNVSLILVDDGSKDNSGKICDLYAKKHENVTVIHKENGGTSSAKNCGLDLAQSAYIALLDSDDYIDNDMFENIVDVIDLYDPDCIDFGFRYISRNGEKTENFHQLSKNIVYDNDFISDEILPPLLNLVADKGNFIFDFAWNKIYKKDILDKYNIRFSEERTSWEDRPFVIDYVNRCNSYYCLDKCFYNYVDIPNSLSRRFTNVYFDAVVENYINYKTKYGKQYNFETQYVYRYWCNSLQKIILWSLKQNEVPLSDVKAKIKEIFSNNEIIELYKKRAPESKEEKFISDLILDGKIDDIHNYYTKKLVKKKRKSFCKRYLSRLKRIFTSSK